MLVLELIFTKIKFTRNGELSSTLGSKTRLKECKRKLTYSALENRIHFHEVTSLILLREYRITNCVDSCIRRAL